MKFGFRRSASGFSNDSQQADSNVIQPTSTEAGSRLDSRTFLPKATGIRLGSSQNVNGVLFSLAFRKVSTLYKYFVLSHLHPGGWGWAVMTAKPVEILWKVLAGPALHGRDSSLGSRWIRGLTAA
jgi:hypothetical protein